MCGLSRRYRKKAAQKSEREGWKRALNSQTHTNEQKPCPDILTRTNGMKSSNVGETTEMLSNSVSASTRSELLTTHPKRKDRMWSQHRTYLVSRHAAAPSTYVSTMCPLWTIPCSESPGGDKDQNAGRALAPWVSGMAATLESTTAPHAEVQNTLS
jgi:hypothetical protein